MSLAEPSGKGRAAARQDAGSRREAAAGGSGVPRPCRWDRLLLAAAQSGLARLLGPAGPLPTAAPCPGGSAEERQLGSSGCECPCPAGLVRLSAPPRVEEAP